MRIIYAGPRYLTWIKDYGGNVDISELLICIAKAEQGWWIKEFSWRGQECSILGDKLEKDARYDLKVDFRSIH